MLACARKGGDILVVGYSGSGMLSDVEEEERAGSLRIWMEDAPHLHGWRKCAHMGEDFKEGRIRTATKISGECSQCTAGDGDGKGGSLAIVI
jgi:hypothetical protein